MAVDSENPVSVVHMIHDMLRHHEDKIFKEWNLTTEQYMVLAAIKHLDSPVRITDVAQRLMRSVNSVSMIVNRMVRAGLLRRVRDTKDRRTVFVSITSRAETRFQPATLSYEEFTRNIMSGVPYGDQQVLIRMLEILQREVR
jgi:DNA-binding MarR family transcriptional regulator